MGNHRRLIGMAASLLAAAAITGCSFAGASQPGTSSPAAQSPASSTVISSSPAAGHGAWADSDSSFIPGRLSQTRSQLLSALAAIPVVPAEQVPGYDRNLFPLWEAPKEDYGWGPDVNYRCNTRWQTLFDDATTQVTFQDDRTCIIDGGIWRDPYGVRQTDGTVSYEESPDPEKFDIDHIVALGDAWDTGASTWSTTKRESLANDPLNLVVAGASANRSKGDKSADQYLPPNPLFQCTYAGSQILVKQKYGLTVNPDEAAALTETVEQRCDD